jgi:hypothetical protein
VRTLDATSFPIRPKPMTAAAAHAPTLALHAELRICGAGGKRLLHKQAVMKHNWCATVCCSGTPEHHA